MNEFLSSTPISPGGKGTRVAIFAAGLPEFRRYAGWSRVNVDIDLMKQASATREAQALLRAVLDPAA
ncbi:hypothetical protein [Aquipseudomonas ullengensis]|uniref:Uncharacterized protein n=1 Tax=Aquipseudomonas ullengensis TaxID=2759166 RepID=A0A7W4QCL9_9GAMM|nr:hypothetical protein [Pseudomonas ullengensis]MBB2493578.1 hypothetical protein [Pseudomonas ullengensis]